MTTTIENGPPQPDHFESPDNGSAFGGAGQAATADLSVFDEDYGRIEFARSLLGPPGPHRSVAGSIDPPAP